MKIDQAEAADNAQENLDPYQGVNRAFHHASSAQKGPDTQRCQI